MENVDGHDVKQIINSIKSAKKQDKPICILANTVKGKGVSFMENQVSWHGKAVNEEQLKEAIENL